MKKVTNAQRTENLKKVAPLNQYLKDNHISQSDVEKRSAPRDYKPHPTRVATSYAEYVTEDC